MRVREMMKSFQKLRKLNRITVEMAGRAIGTMIDSIVRSLLDPSSAAASS